MKIKEVNAGKRLDKFLVEEVKTKTRSQFQKDIEKGLILINKEVKSSHYKLKEGDIVAINKNPTTTEKKEELKEKRKIIKAKKDKFKLVFENNDFLVVNKPAGLIVHGADHIEEETLVDQLLKKYPELKGVGEDDERPGIVHRLDKDASGLMVIAKNNKTFKHLKKQFQQRTVQKIYTVLVFGQIEKDIDKIDFPIKRSNVGNKQAAVPSGFIDKKKQAREALTEFIIEKRLVNYTLLNVKIKTGRKHQIRVHMFAYGHPVVGDILYYTKRTNEQNKKLNLKRMFLVASNLSFEDVKRGRHEFKVRLPKKLKDFLDTVK